MMKSFSISFHKIPVHISICTTNTGVLLFLVCLGNNPNRKKHVCPQHCKVFHCSMGKVLQFANLECFNMLLVMNNLWVKLRQSKPGCDCESYLSWLF